MDMGRAWKKMAAAITKVPARPGTYLSALFPLAVFVGDEEDDVPAEGAVDVEELLVKML